MKNTKIDEFLKQYDNKNTINSYRLGLNSYFNYLEVDPDKYLGNGRDYQKDITDYMNNVLSKKAPYTRNTWITAVKMFHLDNLKEYDQLLPTTFWFRLRRGKNKGARALTLDKVPTPEDLKSILQYASLPAKALFMTLATSGMRVNELLSLKWDDLNLDTNPAQIIIPAHVTKTNRPRYSFITNETRDLLQAYYKVKDSYIDRAVSFGAKPEPGAIFPFSYQNAWNMWNIIIKKADKARKDKTTGHYQYHIHALRKFFRSRLPKVIGVDITEFLMGHENYLTREYRNYPPEELGKEYLKGSERLLIFEKKADTSDIRKSLDEKDIQIQNLEKNMHDQKMELLELRLTIQELKNNKK